MRGIVQMQTHVQECNFVKRNIPAVYYSVETGSGHMGHVLLGLTDFKKSYQQEINIDDVLCNMRHSLVQLFMSHTHLLRWCIHARYHLQAYVEQCPLINCMVIPTLK